ncbi:N-carbamoylputrescine amidase [Methylomarinovum caldicuralii]|uniref:N-carbamoylputrescine amidase n=1 Tax=Methylomarinovum caldicuralii TaxID=438856 RepID=A0AAU9CY65_9GAMM|nr:carbon-nitrogen hydrolase [Methylomarinovum caldicuralii]BCX82972.1 N-carbamoylputrescine amidase [Methylomarinovum caldicuralii]
MPETIRIAAVQQSCLGGHEENLRRLSDATRKAAAERADLVIWPELHNGPYFCQTENPALFDLAETIPGPSTETVGRLAAELQIVIVASLFERRAPGLYHNTAVVFERDGNIAGKYRKMHIPDDPGFYEKFYFTPGDIGFKPIPTSVGKLGVLVCWDQWYPEAARLMALAGADILIYPTAIGWDPRDDEEEKRRHLEAWRLIQRSHAVANGLPVVSCNRIGLEPDPSGQTPGIDFWGHSFICGPQGEYLAQAETEETLVVTQVDFARTEKIRRIWPYLRDRRIDAYEGLTRRWLDD